MPTRRIAILGASARAAAYSALRAGLEPVTADLFADDDLRRVCVASAVPDYPHGFLDWISEQHLDGWIYTGALENYPSLVDELAQLAPLWGNSGSVLRNVRDPLQLQKMLSDAGLLFPETTPASQRPPVDGHWLLKTYAGSSGSGVSRWNADTAQEAFPGYCQRYVEGRPYSALLVADAGKASLLGIARQLVGTKWTSAGPFQYCGSVSVPETAFTRPDELRRIGDTIASRYHLKGLFGVDLVENRDGLWVLEVNPRYPASTEIVERGTGVLAIEHHLRACETGDLAPVVHTGDRITCGKAILFAREPTIVSSDFSARANDQSKDQPWPALADIPASGTQLQPGHPVLTVFAQGNNENQVLKNLRDNIADVEQRLYSSTGSVSLPGDRSD